MQLLLRPFNTYFAKRVIDFQSSIQFSMKKHFHYHLPLNIKSFRITLTNDSEIFNIIPFLKLGKSNGRNSFQTRILKLLNKDKLNQLTILFNQSFSSEMFPLILKNYKVIPLYEKGFRLKCSNYRPISLLYNIDKILERLMYKRLYTFLKKNEVIFLLRFGFWQKYSATHALIHLTDIIRKETDKSTYACGTFVYFQ